MELSDLRSSWRATKGQTIQLTTTAETIPATKAAARVQAISTMVWFRSSVYAPIDMTLKLMQANRPDRAWFDLVNRNTVKLASRLSLGLCTYRQEP